MRSYANTNKKLAKRYDEWMIALHYAPHTQYAYRRIIRRFVEFLGKKSIASVTHLEVRQFAAHVSENGASLDSTYRHLGVLRLFYDFLNLGGVVSYVAPRLVKMRCPPRKRAPLLTELEVQRLMAAAQSLRERAMFEFFYATGCRVGEVTHLKVEDIDFTARTARVVGKFQKARVVLLTKNATEAVRNYVGGRENGFVFQDDRPVQKGCLTIVNGYWVGIWTDYGGPGPEYPRQRRQLGRADQVTHDSALTKYNTILQSVNLVRPKSCRPLTNVGVLQILGNAGRRVGLKNVGPHMLRRSFATHLYDHGASIEVIQALLGHVYLETTLRYTQLSTGRLLETFDKCHPRGNMNAKEWDQDQRRE
jgi:site-specific recombinase XerD